MRSEEPLRYHGARDLPRFIEAVLRRRFGDDVQELPNLMDESLQYQVRRARPAGFTYVPASRSFGANAVAHVVETVPAQPATWFQMNRMVVDELEMEIERRAPRPSIGAQIVTLFLITHGVDDADTHMYDCHAQLVLDIIDEWLAPLLENV